MKLRRLSLSLHTTPNCGARQILPQWACHPDRDYVVIPSAAFPIISRWLLRQPAEAETDDGTVPVESDEAAAIMTVVEALLTVVAPRPALGGRAFRAPPCAVGSSWQVTVDYADELVHIERLRDGLGGSTG